MTRLFSAAVCIFLLTGALFGEVSEPAAKFEIADVHTTVRSRNPDLDEVSGGLLRGGRYELRRATMLDLVRMAWGVDAAKVLGGPNWLELDVFDVRARVPAGTTAATVKPMLQAMLAERFALVAHNDTKPVPAFALTAGKHPQLKPSDGSGAAGCRLDQANGAGREPTALSAAPPAAPPAAPVSAITCHNMTMAAFAAGMGDMPWAGTYIGDNLVLDQTGLEGAWDFSFKFSRRNMVNIAGLDIVTLYDALDKQLGLKLDASLVLMPVVVVDSVNRTPTPNPPDVAAAFPPPAGEFDVADVKPTDPDFHGDDFQVRAGGRVTIRGATLKSMIEDLWGFTGEMVVGAPKFMDTDRWDIVAKAPGVDSDEGADLETIFEMGKALLADRFKLAVHTELRPISSYTLTAPKPKLKKADPASRTSCHEGPPTLTTNDPRNSNPVLARLLTCRNTTMAQLAERLPALASGYVHSPVLDSTGLEGGWDFTLQFSKVAQLRNGSVVSPNEAASDPNGALSLPDAMEKQLGLKMELQKRPVEVLVIDRVERTPTDN